MAVRLDHLVVGARTLAEGQAWLEARLGAPGGGGRHPLMGTENALWRLGESYLEVIAIDRLAEPPGRPRWFGLDAPEIAQRLAGRPRLLTWVARTEDIGATRRASRVDPGPPVLQTRDDLRWRITVPAEGALLLGGAFPYLIEWSPDVMPPPARLSDSGLHLADFVCAAPDPALAPALASIGAAGCIRLEEAVGEPRLRARIVTPIGEVTID